MQRGNGMKIGFDNDKYLKMQSEHIRERISKFDNKLYLEFASSLMIFMHQEYFRDLCPTVSLGCFCS